MQEKPNDLIVHSNEKIFMRWSSGFSGLFWEFERVKSRLRILNQWQHSSLGENTVRLLKDSQYRQQVVCQKDQHLFFEFWDVVASGTQAEIVFRVELPTTQEKLFFWLQGWGSSETPEILSGVLQELPPVLFAEYFNKERPFQYISQASYPVVEVDFQKKVAKICNQAAAELFKVSAFHSQETIALNSILSGDLQKEPWQEIFSMNGGCWSGIQTFRDLCKMPFNAQVRINGLGNHSFHIAFMRIFTKQFFGDLEEKEYSRQLLKKIKTSASLQESLEILLQTLRSDCVDGILFSDIKSNQGSIQVYGAGEVFAKMEWGAAYSYEGTIALEMERYDLPYLLVEDTQDSIKSIDWVLFNPYGVRSYFAKPFYKEKKLHAVLILCSSMPHHFSFRNRLELEKQYSPLYKAFEYAVSLWRNEK